MPNDSAITGFMRQDVVAAALAGLLKPRKTLPPKLFYDEEGSRLFQCITELPEYYLTRTERGIFAAHAEEQSIERMASCRKQAAAAVRALRVPAKLSVPRPNAMKIIDLSVMDLAEQTSF